MTAVIRRLVKERWEVEWFDFTADAAARRTADPDGYEHDHDCDEQSIFKCFPTRDEALAFARTVVETRRTVYGHATVTRQQYLKDEYTPLWAWENVDEPEYVD